MKKIFFALLLALLGSSAVYAQTPTCTMEGMVGTVNIKVGPDLGCGSTMQDWQDAALASLYYQDVWMGSFRGFQMNGDVVQWEVYGSHNGVENSSIGGVATFTITFPAPEVLPDTCASVVSALNAMDSVLSHPYQNTICFNGAFVHGGFTLGINGTYATGGPWRCGDEGRGCAVDDPNIGVQEPCPKGSYTGSVNGVSVCTKPATATQSISSTAAGSDGVAPGKSPVGTATVETSVTCEGGNCTKSSMFKDSAGQVLGRGPAVTSSQSNFCAQNPTLQICKESTTPATDTPLTAVPDSASLYTRKFPDGLAGVWAEKKSAMTSTPLFTLVDKLMPSIGAAGTCPVWMIPLDLGPWNYGEHDVAPPCWIWDFAKAIVILSALLLARALIFGG